MKMKPMNYVFLLLIGPLAGGLACSLLEDGNISKKSSDGGSGLVMLSGIDTKGQERTCPEVVCSPDASVSSPPDSFTAQCAASNHVVKTCACGDYICVDPATLPPPPSSSSNKQAPGAGTFTGYDIKGNHVSCTPTGQEMACTLIYGPEEEFATRCVQAGHEKFDCGCHDYLCSKPVN